MKCPICEQELQIEGFSFECKNNIKNTIAHHLIYYEELNQYNIYLTDIGMTVSRENQTIIYNRKEIKTIIAFNYKVPIEESYNYIKRIDKIKAFI